MSDIYKYAARNKLRFPSKKGDLTAEQLFELPLKSATGADLDTVAKGINAQLKIAGEESFVEDAAANPQRQRLVVALEIVKDAIKTKQEENRAAAERADRAVKRTKLLDAMAAREGQDLASKSLKELKEQLDALDA